MISLLIIIIIRLSRNDSAYIENEKNKENHTTVFTYLFIVAPHIVPAK